MNPAVNPARVNDLLRRIPSVDELLATAQLAESSSRVGRALVVEVTRSVLEELRAEILGHSDLPAADLAPAALAGRVTAAVAELFDPSLRPVINATGVVLHTNLGRAPLAAYAFDHIRSAVTQYSNLEYDLATGARGTRDVHTSRLLARLTGAEAAIVVNNNAAAVFLVLAALARGGEVIVSRGELIEIGDGFRIPDIMAESGAVLREVGTTNRTSLADYESAISDRTRLLLRVHRSNFRVEGFTAQPSLAELIDLSRRTSLPLYEDLGSGSLVDLSAAGIVEPVVRASVSAGVSIVSFSGDKLLGGPQAGVIAGAKELVQRIRRHPMFRALRVDKLTIAALEYTLVAYLRGSGSEGHAAVPALRMIQMDAAEIAHRSEKFLGKLKGLLPAGAAKFDLRDSESVVGGGSTPGQPLATWVIAIQRSLHSPAELESRLRQPAQGIAVIARVEDDRLLLDLRTVFPEQESVLAECIVAALKN
jgi:L-seryl-tRNA(Ser) seleniumtransferase